MKKRFILLLVVLVFILCSCGQEKNSVKDWTYELLEKEFGGIIETDCISVRDCLNILERKEYFICGYMRDVNTTTLLGYNIGGFDLTDEENDNKNTVHVGYEIKDSPQWFTEGDFAYVKGELLESYTDEYQVSSDEGRICQNSNNTDWFSVRDFKNLIDKIYKETYFKTEGIVLQDGEDNDGMPKYYLYPSEEMYKEDKFARVRLLFSDAQSNLIGKRIVVIGKPDVSCSTTLKECSIIEE